MTPKIRELQSVLRRVDVAKLLLMAPETFSRKRPELEQAGFPPKLPGINGWSLACVTTWIESNGQTMPTPSAAMIAATQELDREYA